MEVKKFKLKKGSLSGARSKQVEPIKETNNVFYKRVANENRQRLLDNTTGAEVDFYNLLKGFKIPLEKQKIIFLYKGDQIEKFYIADFQIKGTKVLVEIDGGYHTTPEQKIKDAYRTLLLEQQGFRVLRYDNSEMKDLMKVFKKLNDFI